MPDSPRLTADALLGLLDDSDAARRWLGSLGVRDGGRGFRDLRDLAGRARSPGLAAGLANQLDTLLPKCPDPGMALTNLDRFAAAGADPEAALSSLVLDPRTTEILVQIFSTSQYFSDLLIQEPAWLAWLRAGAERRDRPALVADLWAELKAAPDDDEARRLTLRRFRRRELLRIGYNDIVHDRPLENTTLDLSHLADACVEAAYRLARDRAEARFGAAKGPDDRAARFVVLGLGKLGGRELNYSSDIDLIFLYDAEGRTAGPKPATHAEFFARLGSEVVRLLADHTALGPAYRVDMRLRPEGERGPLARSLASTLGYYETAGRTWERQALIKCRPIAGDLELGRAFLSAINPFVYRRYLGGAEINEIKAMKRRIEQRTVSAGTAEVEVKTGRGGIRDVEFVVQFLQLLHGGQYPEVRHANTLIALARLEAVGCLDAEERGIMEDTYRFLRKVEHRLQTMFDRQTHQMPVDPEELRTLAIRMGYASASPWEDRVGPAQRFLADYRAKAELNRRILNHLLHDAFRDDAGGPADPVVDLVLDPEPTPELIASALAPYPFTDRPKAYRNLLALAREEIPFLSQARCRHFLAAIAPRLLQALGKTPDPDLALTNLEKVSASLGAKAVLWELFSFNPPTLRLFVDLCATSPFLSEILINNPGMIDDLMDSLVVGRTQPGSAIRAELAELCRGAEDLAPILVGFRNKEWVRIGTHDILGKVPIRDVARELADVAGAVVGQVARDQARRGPWAAAGRRRHAPRWAILGLGKLGGRELNYGSDLDLVFVSEAGDPAVAEVARRVLKALGGAEGLGALYAVDARLRPHGASGPLVPTLEAFAAYYRSAAQPWERLALTRARVVYAVGDFGRAVSATLRQLLLLPVDPAALAREVVAMRGRLEASRGSADLKRRIGGIVDIEFVAQYLQLVHAPAAPEVLRPNTWEALDALRRAGALAPAAHRDLRRAYDFLRTVESRLRIVHNRGAADLPTSPAELARLAHRLGYDDPDPSASVAALHADLARHASKTRQLFRRVVAPPAGEAPPGD